MCQVIIQNSPFKPKYGDFLFGGKYIKRELTYEDFIDFHPVRIPGFLGNSNYQNIWDVLERFLRLIVKYLKLILLMIVSGILQINILEFTHITY